MTKRFLSEEPTVQLAKISAEDFSTIQTYSPSAKIKFLLVHVENSNLFSVSRAALSVINGRIRCAKKTLVGVWKEGSRISHVSLQAD